MLIALDYDETYTKDPIFWDQVISLATSRGHSVICTTMRYRSEGEEVIRDLSGKVENIIFTERNAKQEFVNNCGYMPSVWIDDNPSFIVNDAYAAKKNIITTCDSCGCNTNVWSPNHSFDCPDIPF
jgi:hypothetical protein